MFEDGSALAASGVAMGFCMFFSSAGASSQDVAAAHRQIESSAQLDPQTAAARDLGRDVAKVVEPPHVVVMSRENLVTLATRRPRLADVLEELSALTRIPITYSESIADAPVTIAIDKVDVQDAIRAILAPYNVFYLYSGPEKTSGSMVAAWAYARGEGRDFIPVPPSQWGSTKALRDRLYDPAPGVREQAYEALLEREGKTGLPTLMQALSDDSADVRGGALAAALDAGVDVPASELVTIISIDPSPRVRSLALEAAATKPEAKDIARSALRDPSPDVREQAASLLKEATTDANDEQVRILPGSVTQRIKKGG